MLRYAVFPLLLLALTSCGSASKKINNHSDHPSDDHVKNVEMGMNEYYGCVSNGPIAVINFDFDKSVVSDAAKDVLKEVYTKCIHDHLSNNPDVKLLITGHTDRHGTVEYNIALGSRRSDAAQRVLHEISSTNAKSSVEHQPVAADDDHNESDLEQHKALSVKEKSCVTSKGKEEQLYGSHVEDADAKNRRAVLEFVDNKNCE